MFQVTPRHDDPPIMAALVTEDNIAELAAQFGGHPATIDGAPGLKFDLDRRYNLGAIAEVGSYIVKHPKMLRDVEILPREAFDRAYRETDDGNALDRAVAAEFPDCVVDDWVVVVYGAVGEGSAVQLIANSQHRPGLVGMLTIAAKQLHA